MVSCLQRDVLYRSGWLPAKSFCGIWNIFVSPVLTRLKKEKCVFRSEMICRVEEAKHEMESRLDSQRRHMVQKESVLQNEIEELKVSMIFWFPNPL